MGPSDRYRPFEARRVQCMCRHNRHAARSAQPISRGKAAAALDAGAGSSARFPRLNADRCGGSRVRTEGAKKSYSWEELNRSKKIECTYSSNPRFTFGDDQTYSHLGAGHHSRAHWGDRPGLSVNSVAVGGDHPARVLAWRSGV